MISEKTTAIRTGVVNKQSLSKQSWTTPQKLHAVCAILLISILIANLIAFAMKKVYGTWFWSVIIVNAVLAYWILPNMKKNK